MTKLNDLRDKPKFLQMNAELWIRDKFVVVMFSCMVYSEEEHLF